MLVVCGRKYTKPIVLGHNRLSIIELSKSGAQPMLHFRWEGLSRTTENFIIIRNLGKVSKTNLVLKSLGNSDTEVFLHGFCLLWSR